MLKNWCFWIAVLGKKLKSTLDCKDIQPVHPKGSQSWISTGGTDVKAETPILWPPDVKKWLIWKDPGHDWKWKVNVEVAQLCPTLCNPMDCTVHGILQARILEWVAFPFSRRSSQPRDRTQVSRNAGRFFTIWATTLYIWQCHFPNLSHPTFPPTLCPQVCFLLLHLYSCPANRFSSVQ